MDSKLLFQKAIQQILFSFGVGFLRVGLSDASHDVHYGDLYDSCCLQVPAGMASSEFDTERRHFMSHLNDIVMRLLLHQVMLVTGALYTPYSLDPSCTVHATRHC